MQLYFSITRVLVLDYSAPGTHDEILSFRCGRLFDRGNNLLWKTIELLMSIVIHRSYIFLHVLTLDYSSPFKPVVLSKMDV